MKKSKPPVAPAAPIVPIPFSDQDAQLIVDAAQKAPLPNLEVATALAQALQRFQPWYKLACLAVNQLSVPPDTGRK